MSSPGGLDAFPVIEKAAAIITLDELELDAEASRKAWDSRYGEAKLTPSRAAAFTGRAKKKGMFDGDGDDEADAGADLFAPQAPGGKVEAFSLSAVDADLLSVGEDDFLLGQPSSSSFQKASSAPAKPSASKTERAADLFGGLEEEEDALGLLDALSLKKKKQQGAARGRPDAPT